MVRFGLRTRKRAYTVRMASESQEPGSCSRAGKVETTNYCRSLPYTPLSNGVYDPYQTRRVYRVYEVRQRSLGRYLGALLRCSGPRRYGSSIMLMCLLRRSISSDWMCLIFHIFLDDDDDSGLNATTLLCQVLFVSDRKPSHYGPRRRLTECEYCHQHCRSTMCALTGLSNKSKREMQVYLHSSNDAS